MWGADFPAVCRFFMAKPLVIVESPAKARTLGRFLGSGYTVEASFGHVRDLPESAKDAPKDVDKEVGRLGVDVENGFAPLYIVPSDKRKHVARLRSALKGASELILATDPDREGESISWHLRELLKPGRSVPVRRIVFHEITEEAVRAALGERHGVNEPLVRAQEARRILDRLYGYMVSPVLWRKVQTGLSAGRVQSVAVRLIVEREEERRRFASSTYWDLEARLGGGDLPFTATLVKVGGERVASGRDFDATSGVLTSRNVRLLDEAAARQLAGVLGHRLPWTVTGLEQKPATQRPYAPFTTSTLQQEANRKLGFSADRTMSIAQRLFQGVEVGHGEMEGLISYHRTDSTTLSDRAVRESARVIHELFGADYYRGPRQYQTRVRNAQEAHEAIRPTDFRLTPQELERRGVLESDDLRLYELIWKRTIASQMADAQLVRTTLEITATTEDGLACVFTATGKSIEFAGFLRAYVEGSDDPAAELGDQETLLPACRVGDLVNAAGSPHAIVLHGVDARGHETSPPPRYTEASLVKKLEEEGIGRPSTYAPTIATIQRRGYVFRQGKALVPSFTAFAVTNLLRDHFTEYVDVKFTAKLEDILDDISNGDKDWLDFLREFYFGGGDEGPGLKPKVDGSGEEVSYPVVEVGVDPKDQRPIVVRIGRYGPFLQRGDGGEGNTVSLSEDLAPADLTIDRAVSLLEAKAAGPRSLGTDPASGKPVYVLNGRFGPYVQLGRSPDRGSKEKPPRASLPAGVTEHNVTLERALLLLSLPRQIGHHPADGEPVVANFGRFGPYVKHGDEFRSLEGDDQVFSVTLEEAVELLRQPKRSRARRAATKTVLRELGVHPSSGSPVNLFDGRYGPYVSDGTVNASLPKGAAPDAFTLADAVTLLEERGKAPKRKAPRRGGRKAS
jgi:DNA topoisomerase-1